MLLNVAAANQADEPSKSMIVTRGAKLMNASMTLKRFLTGTLLALVFCIPALAQSDTTP